MGVMDKHRSFIDKAIRNSDGRVTLWQTPNLPLVVWVAARLLAWPLSGGLEHFVGLVGTAAILLWALLELLQGVNYFRRALGLVALAMTIMSLAR